jgi:NAD(P)-dependent dehydrogenase (short-subunit alcohol dehydrogenase family)
MKYVLITGASTGIGYSSAKYLLDKGFFVFGSVRKLSDAEKLEKYFGKNFKALIFDVIDETAIKNAVPIVAEIVGENGLAGLVNNAGIAVSGPMQSVTTEQLRYQLDVNVLGVHRVTNAFLHLLGATEICHHEPGRIIQISSVNGILSPPFTGPYAASKFALEAISDALRREMVLFGIKVIIIQPGPIKTPIWGKALSNEGADYADTPYARILSKRAKSLKKIEANAIPAEEVAKLIHQSIVLKNPKTRYLVAKKSWQFKLFSMLPDKWLDHATTKAMKKYSFYKPNK